jgi:hypothetical protein
MARARDNLQRMLTGSRSRHARSAASLALALALALTTLGGPRLARAQGGADKAAAQSLFDEGKALLTAGKVAEACPKLEESLRLDPGIGTMLFLGECWERQGRTASAWAQFKEAESQAEKQGDPRLTIARDRASRLAPDLSKLVVEVPKQSAIEGLVVTRDGTEIGRALWGRPTPVDPGEHVVRATAPGHVAWESKVSVGKKADSVSASVPLLVAEASVAKPPPPTPVTPPVAPPAEEPEGRGGTQRALGLGLGVAGLVGVGFGVGFGLSAISKNDRADAECPGGACSQEGVTAGDDARQQGNLSTIAFVVGGVLLGGGAVLFFTAPRARSSATLRPTPSGLSLTF